MNPTTPRTVTRSERTSARVDPSKVYVVTEGARMVSGQRCRFAPGTRVMLHSGASGRADSDGDVTVYPLNENGSRRLASGDYVWAVDLVEPGAAGDPTVTTGPTGADYVAAMDALDLPTDAKKVLRQVAEAIAAGRS